MTIDYLYWRYQGGDVLIMIFIFFLIILPKIYIKTDFLSKSLNISAGLILIIFFCISIIPKNASAQDTWWKDKRYHSEEKRQRAMNCKNVFMNIADGLNYSNVNYVTPYFGSEVYLNVQADEQGYYTPDQSRYILENFFGSNPVSSFRWKNCSHSDTYAFAIGKYKYQKSGFINTYTISVSIKYINDLWVIDQILVN